MKLRTKIHLFLFAFAGSFLFYKFLVVGEFWMSGTEQKSEIPSLIKDQLRRPQGVNEVEAQNPNADPGNAYLGRTALLIAVTQARPDWVEALLDVGANIDWQDNPTYANNITGGGNTALHYAINQWGLTNNDVYRDIINILLAHKAGVKIQNAAGSTPLHLVIGIDISNIDKRVDLTKRLLVSGADINQQDKMGNTLLHLTVQRGDVRWMRLLLSPEFQKFLQDHNQELKMTVKSKLGRNVIDEIAFFMYESLFDGEPLIEGGVPNSPNNPSLYTVIKQMYAEQSAKIPNG